MPRRNREHPRGTGGPPGPAGSRRSRTADEDGDMDELERIAADAAAGDPLAAAALVRRTQSDVWRLCAALGDPASADDLTQETYLRAFGSLHRFEHRSSVRTWLFVIARRVCADAVRARRRRRVTLVGDEHLEGLADIDGGDRVAEGATVTDLLTRLVA